MGEIGHGSPVRTSRPTKAPLYGVGAPDDRDWDAVEDATGDQGVGLPPVGSFVLYNLFPPLKHKQHFDIWFQIVTLILESYGLHRLIDKSIERPMRNSPNAEKWMELSLLCTPGCSSRDHRDWSTHEVGRRFHERMQIAYARRGPWSPTKLARQFYENATDTFTKPLPMEPFEEMR
ncbi:hypothetical protein PCH_Pc16g05950 [Penicillium rubens Wisconsin 54-1255]|uniref:Uncharacterized protein n=1 Tax=Penicillium rubens (strain ATCC 28089 / DSM 1075 / NRRL 1951 / Wisconsin 54-1255) TaxID=500485 RepID=B6H8M9_PENRW|nr:hypothetical protein PCH_Pc16g05950 [Penicillium rubens Wisconsin 54-1255]